MGGGGGRCLQQCQQQATCPCHGSWDADTLHSRYAMLTACALRPFWPTYRCMTSQKPQKFDADRAQFLANMTEVVVRQLERRWARELADRKEGTHLARSLECYDMAYMLVDASTPDWRVIYMNNASQDLLGECMQCCWQGQ